MDSHGLGLLSSRSTPSPRLKTASFLAAPGLLPLPATAALVAPPRVASPAVVRRSRVFHRQSGPVESYGRSDMR